jgi:hypothetical protein
MVRKVLIPAALGLLLIKTPSAQAQVFKEVPPDLVFWNPVNVHTLSERDKAINWTWPSAEEITDKAPKDAAIAEEAKEEAEYWLRTLTNESLVPPDVKNRMLLLDEPVDRIVARYIVDDLAVECLQTKRSLHLLVRKVGAQKVSDLADIAKLVHEVAQKLFAGANGPVPTLSVPLEFIRKRDYGARVLVATGNVSYYTREGDDAIYLRPDKALMYAFWWGLTVNTDGETIHFENIMKRTKPPEPSELQPQPRPMSPAEANTESWFVPQASREDELLDLLR